MTGCTGLKPNNLNPVHPAILSAVVFLLAERWLLGRLSCLT
jgi:hypothetical protein